MAAGAHEGAAARVCARYRCILTRKYYFSARMAQRRYAPVAGCRAAGQLPCSASDALGRFLPKLGPLHRGPFFCPDSGPVSSLSECLDPGPQLDFPGPGAALLAVEVEILGGN